jgi:GxxExxY protein
LALSGLTAEREKVLPLTYRGHVIENAYRLDLIVNGKLLVELKAIEAIQPIHRVQVTTYLKLLHQPLGLLINFNVPLIKDGITRVLNLDFRTQAACDCVEVSALSIPKP